MKIQNLVICDSKTIFDILVEIKEELNCNLLFKLKEDLNKLTNIDDYLILSENYIEDLDNQISVGSFPIKINKLIEIINISFLKKNFNLQSDIMIGEYKINLNSRKMSKKNEVLNLTEKETLLIIHLKNQKNPCSVNELQKLVWKQSADLETHTVETHIYRLRKKIRDIFKDGNFIISLKNGYKIY
tara:strand:+ start:138 stop:695 length:558 start_codon:yes stop_codon:yes gene_type:complete